MARFFYLVALVVLTALLPLTLHATTMTVADALIISAIDDKTVEHGFIGNKSTFNLDQGEHSVVLRYKDVYEDIEFAEERVVESKEFVVKFTIGSEQKVNLITSDIKSLSQAERFAKSPQLYLSDVNNRKVKLELIELDDYKLAKQVNIAVASYTSPSEKNPLVNSQQETNKTSSVLNKTDNKQLNANSSDTAINSFTMLKYWWQHASDVEKSKFKEFILTQ